MKHFKQLVKELPTRKVVFAIGRFQPPSAMHESMINAVKKIAENKQADHIIYTSTTDKKSDPLTLERKMYYLKRMFPTANFSEETSLNETLSNLSKKYKDISIVVPVDRFQETKKQCEKYNVEVISISEMDADATSPMRNKLLESVKKNDFNTFKNSMPLTLTELDSKRLMNDMRSGFGLEIVKEQIKFETNDIREKYFAGEIFHVGDIVECNDTVYRIVKRGSNHLLIEDETGNKISKWPQDLMESTKQFTERNTEMIDENELDMSEEDMNAVIESISEEEYLEAYDDSELFIIDEDSGEYITDLSEDTLLEVLSRAERIRAKLRFARSEAKRERRTKIALKTRSNTATINKRARRLAISVMKKRLAKKPLEKLSVSEKERLEATIAKRKKIVDRIAMRLVPQVKKIESDRLSHKQFTK